MYISKNKWTAKKKNFDSVSVCGHSTEVLTGIILTDGDINILFTFISNKNISKLFQAGNGCRPVLSLLFWLWNNDDTLLVVVLLTVVCLFQPSYFDHNRNEGGLLISDS